MSESPLLFTRVGPIARLVLNRPDVGNALDVPLTRALLEAAIACDEDDAIRCVVLTGAGRLFCAGGDIAGFASSGDGLPALLKELLANINPAVSILTRMAKPLLCVINGPAAGAGLSLAILGDYVLAARSAHFTLAYGGVGLSPDAGATWLLPRLIGLRRTQDMAVTNRRVGAEEAAAIGLVTRVVDDETLTAEADAIAATLAATASRSIGRTRQLLLGSFETSLDAQIQLEARAIAEGARDPDGREGVAAFLERRKPLFSGRRQGAE
jgi:2-(1,2-epoxy-1,2-dihydrophenyl)acetyl-CoA isomerase